MPDTESKDWVVRVVRRDNENRWYFFDKHGSVNARIGSAMRLDKDTAVGLSKAINANSEEWKARAFLYTTSKAQKDAALEAARKPDALKSEEQVEIESLREEVKSLKSRIAEMSGNKTKEGEL